MAEYAPGMRVIVRDEEWIVKKCDRNSFGSTTLKCEGLSPLVKDKEACFLTDLEKIETVDPTQTKLIYDDSPYYMRSKLYIESRWRQLMPTDSALHIGHQAVMNVVPYQLEPAEISLKRPKQRILIADAVGLGKTLEAGILMSELIARGKGRRILVVTVKSMMNQFQKEMWERFTIPLISLDSAAIKRIRADMPINHNPFHYYDKTIVSIDTIKRDDEYETHLENARWDIIVIDEAHNVARRGNKRSERSKLADILASRSDTLIMLSATPHDGSASSFASLMNMLDPTAIPNPDDYTQADIKDNAGDIKGLFVRRFKKDIQDQTDGKFMQRHVSSEACWASAREEAALECFEENEKLLSGEDSAHLRGMVFRKALFSSPAACIKSISERKKKLKDNFTDEAAREKRALDALHHSLTRIETKDFTRYMRLIALIKDPDYGWRPSAKDDRLVIFTERIETMRYLAERLREDLNLSKDAVITLHGGMSDIEQQQIVENFGRDEAPVRVLVASDVASEGINLHYLCHRLIHFDIPWSLMVFQQRNGRIDRYGQTREPDIRYMVMRTQNQRIRVDMRILDVLIHKEEQATKNIGDPALLMNVFDTQREEEITYSAIRSGDEKAFESLLTIDEEADPFSFMMEQDEKPQAVKPKPNIKTDATLMSDIDFLTNAFTYLSADRKYAFSNMQTVKGVEITVTDDMRRRFENVLPNNEILKSGYIRLSPDREFCAGEIARSLQSGKAESVWHSVQYLWRLHPIMNWLCDKAGQFYGRQEAPLIRVKDMPDARDMIYCVAGLIPNRRSTPMVDEWFALRYIGGRFEEVLTIEQALDITGFKNRLPNAAGADEGLAARAEELLEGVILQARRIMTQSYKRYKESADEQIYAELAKLAALEERHKQSITEKYEQLSIFGKERRKDQEIRYIEDIFKNFYSWVTDSKEITDNPYLRIIAVFAGVDA